MQQDTAGQCPVRFPLPHAEGLGIGTGFEVDTRDCRAALLHGLRRPAWDDAQANSRHQQRPGHLALHANPRVRAAHKPVGLPGGI